MPDENDPVLAKIADIRAGGLAAIADMKMGTFQGFSPELAYRVNVSYIYNTDEDRRLGSFHARIADAARKKGVEILLAGRDFPMHLTLLEADYQGDEEKYEEELHRFRTASSSLVRKIIRDTNMFVFEEFVLDRAGNGLLLMRGVPAVVVEAREKIRALYEAFGWKTRDLTHIGHSTQFRIQQYIGQSAGNFWNEVNYIPVDDPVFFPFPKGIHIGSAQTLLQRPRI